MAQKESEVSTIDDSQNDAGRGNEKDQVQYATEPYDEKGREEAGNETGQSVSEVIQLPDGGFRAWLVILGCFIDLFASFGLMNSYVSRFVTMNPELFDGLTTKWWNKQHIM